MIPSKEAEEREHEGKDLQSEFVGLVEDSDIMRSYRHVDSNPKGFDMWCRGLWRGGGKHGEDCGNDAGTEVSDGGDLFEGMNHKSGEKSPAARQK
jgi:hypothetical protein